MAFDFLGTIPSFERFEEFEEFIQKEAEHIDARVKNLTVERLRHLELVDKYLTADSRLRSDYPKSLRPDRKWLEYPRPMQIEQKSNPDAANAVDVEILKKTFLGAIKQKREKNEYRVKRLLDLSYQLQEEINQLENMKDRYQDYLNKIRARFDIEDFEGNQRNEAQDSAELVEGITRTPVDKGIIEEDGTKYYLVTSINAEFNTISFDEQAPPVKEGSKIILSEGKNNGTKTVLSIKNSRTLVIYESLVAESNSKTKVAI